MSHATRFALAARVLLFLTRARDRQRRWPIKRRGSFANLRLTTVKSEHSDSRDEDLRSWPISTERSVDARAAKEPSRRKFSRKVPIIRGRGRDARASDATIPFSITTGEIRYRRPFLVHPYRQRVRNALRNAGRSRDNPDNFASHRREKTRKTRAKMVTTISSHTPGEHVRMTSGGILHPGR